MPRIQSDVNVANFVDIEVANDVHNFLYFRFDGWKYIPFILTNQKSPLYAAIKSHDRYL